MSTSIALTKFANACVRLEKNGRRIVIDPGEFSDPSTALDAAEHVLITHEHPDHLEQDAVLTWLASAKSATVFAPEVPARLLRERALAAGADERQIIAVGAGERFECAGFSVRTVGGQHAVIHRSIPVVQNVGFIVDGLVYHPGDSFIVPEGPVPDTVLVPLSGPWSNMSDMVDFIIAVRPRQVIPVHEIVLDPAVGRPLYVARARLFAERYGVMLTDLAVGESHLIDAAGQ